MALKFRRGTNLIPRVLVSKHAVWDLGDLHVHALNVLYFVLEA